MKRGSALRSPTKEVQTDKKRRLSAGADAERATGSIRSNSNESHRSTSSRAVANVNTKSGRFTLWDLLENDLCHQVVSFLLPPSDCSLLSDGERRVYDFQHFRDPLVDLGEALPLWPVCEALRNYHQLLANRLHNLSKTSASMPMSMANSSDSGSVSGVGASGATSVAVTSPSVSDLTESAVESKNAIEQTLSAVERRLSCLLEKLSAQELTHCGIRLCFYFVDRAPVDFCFQRGNPNCECVRVSERQLGTMPPSAPYGDKHRRGMCCSHMRRFEGRRQDPKFYVSHVPSLNDIPLIPLKEWTVEREGDSKFPHCPGLNDLFWATFVVRTLDADVREREELTQIFLKTLKDPQSWPADARVTDVLRKLLRQVFAVGMTVVEAGENTVTSASTIDLQNLAIIGANCQKQGWSEVYESDLFQHLLRKRVLEEFTALGEGLALELLQPVDNRKPLLYAELWQSLIPDRGFWTELIGKLTDQFYTDIEDTLAAFNEGLGEGEIANQDNLGMGALPRENHYFTTQGVYAISAWVHDGFLPTQDVQKILRLQLIMDAFVRISVQQWMWSFSSTPLMMIGDERSNGGPSFLQILRCLQKVKNQLPDFAAQSVGMVLNQHGRRIVRKSFMQYGQGLAGQTWPELLKDLDSLRAILRDEDLCRFVTEETRNGVVLFVHWLEAEFVGLLEAQHELPLLVKEWAGISLVEQAEPQQEQPQQDGPMVEAAAGGN